MLRDFKLLTHKGCSDGSLCAVLFRRCGGKKENIIFSNASHDETDEHMEHLLYDWEGPIIIADLSISKQMADKCQIRKDIILLDHHKSAIPLSKYSWCIIDKLNKKCGSELFMNWLLKNKYLKNSINESILVSVISDLDRWQWKKGQITKNISTLFNALGQDLFEERFIKDITVCLTDNEKYLISIENKKIDKFVEEKIEHTELFIKNINGKDVRIGVVDANKNQSVLGNAMCNDVELNLDFAMMIGTKTISLRSKDDRFDVSTIAELNGGGGHFASGGFSLYHVLSKSLVDLVMENIILNFRE